MPGIAATSALGMSNAQLSMATTAANIANSQTPAYYAQEFVTTDLGYQTIEGPGASDLKPSGLQLGLGPKSLGTFTYFKQGLPTYTGDPYHIFIEGQGFLSVVLPDGRTGYTRAGILQRDHTGKLITMSGLEVQPGIVIPEEVHEIQIASNGEITALIKGKDPQKLGRLSLVKFNNPGGLFREGEGIYTVSQASGDPIESNPGEIGFGTILQHHYEGSNIELVLEITKLIQAQRTYEMNSQVMKAEFDRQRTDVELAAAAA